jgi:hypothetical protein
MQNWLFTNSVSCTVDANKYCAFTNNFALPFHHNAAIGEFMLTKPIDEKVHK